MKKKSFEKKHYKKTLFLTDHENTALDKKNNVVFGVKKTALDRILCYKRTALKEECL